MKALVLLLGSAFGVATVLPASGFAHTGREGAPGILGPGYHDAPGPPPILTSVYVSEVSFPYWLWKDDAGAVAEISIMLTVTHAGHGTKTFRKSEANLGWTGPPEGWGSWPINSNIYTHPECTPMAPITVQVTGFEADATNLDEFERKVAKALKDLAEILDLLAELLGQDLPISLENLVLITVWLLSVLNPDDTLGTATAIIPFPDFPVVVRTSGGDYDVIVDFLASAAPQGGSECDGDSVPAIVPPPPCEPVPSFFDSLAAGWVQTQSIGIEPGNPGGLTTDDIADARSSLQSLCKQLGDWVSLGMVSTAWGLQGASSALAAYQSGRANGGPGAFTHYGSAYCQAEMALRNDVSDPNAGAMPKLATAVPTLVSTRRGRTAKWLVGVFGTGTSGTGIGSVSGVPTGASYQLRQFDPTKPWYELSVTQYADPGTYPLTVSFTDPAVSPLVLTLEIDAPSPVDSGDDAETRAPRVTALHPCFPNPFNPDTNIRFDLAAPGRAVLRVHDVSGRAVRTLVDDDLAVGPHAARWDGADNAGRRVASGVYYVTLWTGSFSASRRLVLLE